MSLITNDPAPIVQFSPIVILSITVVPVPIHVPSPTVVFPHKTLFGDNKDNNSEELDFEDIIINPPATIVKWDDGTKTVVKCQNGDVYDAEKGIALCFMKKMFNNKSYYNEVIKEAIAVNEARQNKK